MKLKVGKKTYKWNPLILIRNIIILAVILFLAWFAISYVDIAIHNLESQNYLDWNMLTLITHK